MSNLTLFHNNEFGAIRVVNDETNEPWFVVNDICNCFGVTNKNRAMSRLDDDERGVRKCTTPGGVQELAVVNEGGMYSLLFAFEPQKGRGVDEVVLKEKQDRLKKFKRWVTHEVLPELRKTGAYVYSNGQETDEDLMARALMAAQRTIERNNKALEEKNAELEILRPKAMFADAVAASNGTCLVGELAKMMTQAGFEIGQNRLFAKLREDGYLGKSGSNRNVPLQRYVEMGLFKIKETAITHADGHTTLNRTTKVTGKGQRYFMEKYAGVRSVVIDEVEDC